MLDLVELLTHWHAGRSQVRLSESLGMRSQDGPQIYGAGDRRRYRARWGAAERRAVGGVDRRVVS